MTPCPLCGKQATQATHPFCSQRCADIDLGRWLTDRYIIPDTTPAPPDERE